jgi:hypothetical protein
MNDETGHMKRGHEAIVGRKNKAKKKPPPPASSSPAAPPGPSSSLAAAAAASQPVASTVAHRQSGRVTFDVNHLVLQEDPAVWDKTKRQEGPAPQEEQEQNDDMSVTFDFQE